jgi:thioredoxin-like negative regulator of GroEL
MRSLLVLAAAGWLATTSMSADHAWAGEPAPAAANLPQLVFFQNPKGMPCVVQGQVLDQMEGELKTKVQLRSYRTDRREDLAAFSQFRIRALPTLVLLDAAGKEIRRGTPGVQSAEQVRALVGM